MPTNNLMECSDNYSKISESLSQYCRNERNNNIKMTYSFKFKSKFKNNTNTVGNATFEIPSPIDIFK